MRYFTKFIIFAIAILIGVPAATAQTLYGYNNWCQVGGQTVNFNGSTSNTTVQASYPLCTVTVFLAGTSTLATIYSDSSATVQGNPFNANFDASFNFFAPGGAFYDVVISGAGIPHPRTFQSICLGCTAGVGGVSKIIAGANISITPSTGLGNVTINATGGGAGGCVTSGIGLFQLSNGGGGCTSTLADYDISESGSFDFHPTNNFNVVMNTGTGQFNVTGLGNANFTMGGDFNVSSAAGVNIANSTSGNFTLAQTSTGPFNISAAGGMNTTVQGTYTLSANNGMNMSVAGTLAMSAGAIHLIAPVQIFNSAATGNTQLDPSGILSGDSFNIALPRFTGTMALYTGSLTPGDCTKVNATGNGFIDAGAPCGSAGSSFYQFTQNNGSALPQQGKLNFINSSGILGTNNSGNGSTDISLSGIPNSSLANSGITITPGTGLTGGGTISLGGSTTLSTSSSVPLLGVNNTFSGLQTFSNVLITGSCSGCNGGVNQIVAGTNVTISPGGGTGVVTINSTSTASTAWSALTAGTNTGNAFIIGAGGSLGATGGGTITATALPYTGLTGSVPTWNQNTTGSAATLTNSRTLAGNSFDGSANVPFANKFIVQGTADAGLVGAQFLGALATGIVKNTTATGVLSIAAAGTDYLTPTGSATGLSKASAAAFGVSECDGTTITCVGGIFVAVGGGGGGNTTSTSLTTNTLTKANGANSIINSLFTDNGTTATYSGTGGISTPSMTLSDTVNNGQDIWTTGSGGDATCVLNTASASFTNCIKGGIPQVSIGPSGAFVPYTLGPTIADVTTTVGTGTINANTCGSVVTVTMTGVASTMTFSFTPNADISATTGWGSTGGLSIVPWPTTNTLNYKVCNATASNITPSGSVTFNVSAK